MQFSFGEVVVWILIGFVAGTLATWLIRGKRRGGAIYNLVLGLVGAIIGGFLFNLLNINLGLPSFTFSLDDLVAAFVGSLVVIFLVSLLRR
jgi:uncharacterized membrane protein YeaQ/YmgE (transglycosylase-associated protein family)